ncbi:hypothetical protein, partial [Clostridium perfringens]
FDTAHPADDTALRQKGSKAPYNVIINRTAAADLGFANPAAAIGQSLDGNGTMTIVGVVDDLRFRGPREPVASVEYRYASQPFASPY